MARARADTLAIGLDAASDTLAYAARRAARERLPNLVLIREPLEQTALESVADEVSVHVPWGSLLRGALTDDAGVFAAICRLPRPAGVLSLLLSVLSRDGHAPLTDRDIERMTNAYRSHGYTLMECRAAVRADVDAARSSWGKRLDVGGRRPGLLLRFIRDGAPSASPVGSAPDDR